MAVRRILLVAALAAVLGAPASAQNWPERTVRLVVPYPPGGNVDGAARIIANKLQDKLGLPADSYPTPELVAKLQGR